MSESDRELVTRAQRGDKTAIAELFSRYWRAARAAAFGVTGEFASAEDAAADAFHQALAGIDSLRDPDRFGCWLRTIVMRKAQPRVHGGCPAIAAFADDLSDQNERPDEALARMEIGALVQQAVRQLPERLREAMALIYFEGYDPADAARFLEIPPGTLRRRLHNGRARVRSAIEQALRGRNQINEQRESQIRSLSTMIENGEIYRAFRAWLELRPPPSELMDMFVRREMRRTSESQSSDAGKKPAEVVHHVIQELLRPSDRVSDPAHPVGSIAAAIRQALPNFQDWPLNARSAAVRVFSTTGRYRHRVRPALPPGFAEGRPGAFVRATRAIVRLDGDGRVQSIFEHLQASPDEQAFRAARNDLRLSDAVDLTWMVVGALELRSVQEMLERLISAVLPAAHVQFATYDEPRYRSALQLRFHNVPARAAYGGVLSEWPGRPNGVDAAHVRIFLEPWAALQSREIVEFEPLPEKTLSPSIGKVADGA
ncbi:MAG TPA: sigma-70 family RNA polymerase sigma factor [Bryobacteraceae bacterium]|nr:sigma-70 family RNA polymerase sigma factor [Bryobacteraceae bacterium]